MKGNAMSVKLISTVLKPCWKLGALSMLCISIQGCLYMPLPAKLTWGTRVPLKEIEFIQAGVTPMSDIVERFGKPDREFPEPHVAVYWWVERTGVWAVMGPCYGVGGADTIERTGLFLIGYGSDGLVKKVELRRAPRQGVTENFITAWSSAPAKKMEDPEAGGEPESTDFADERR